MPLNKTHLLKKAKKNIEIFSEVIKTYKTLKNEPATIEEKVDFLVKENEVQKEEIKNLKNKCDLLEGDILKMVHSINVLNYVLEAVILNNDEIPNLKKNIKYH
jgi:hypothetical protein